MAKRKFLENLELHKDNLTKSQMMIAKYILLHADEVAQITANEFAKKLNISNMTITRFVVAIGYTNFSELKASLRNGEVQHVTPHERVVMALDVEKKRIEHNQEKNNSQDFLSYDIDSLKKFGKNFDYAKINDAVDLINDAKTIYLMGLGSTAALIDVLQIHLRRLGFKIVNVSEGSVYNTDKLISITEDDLLLAVTFPQYSAATIDSITYARGSKAKVLTITDNTAEFLIEKSTLALTLDIEWVFNKFTFFNSIVVPTELCNLLLMKIFLSDKERFEKNIKENTEKYRMLRSSF